MGPLREEQAGMPVEVPGAHLVTPRLLHNRRS
jgi:hypothetical protein